MKRHFPLSAFCFPLFTVLLAFLLPDTRAQAAGAGFPITPHASTGALLYVPIYSSIFYKDGQRTIELTATLSIHNVDPEHPLTLTRIDYHDTAGKLIRQHLESPIDLPPLATKNIVVNKEDRSGGTGANFMVAWKSATPIAPPIVEALMVSVASSQSISFTSEGKVVRSAELAK